MVQRLLLLTLLAFGVSAGAQERSDVVLADFEGDDYGGWKVEGTAFGRAPAHGTLPNQQPVSGHRGRGLANSFVGGDKSTGTLTSPEFLLERKHLQFLIGGGEHPEKTEVQLLVDGKIVRRETGAATTGADDEHLSLRSWDVADLAGKKAQIRIVDEHRGGWGHINVDHFVLSDSPGETSLANESLTRAAASVAGATARAAADPERPIYHVAPPALWCNDPNGPLWLGGYYHLFYQHNPYGDRWEHMHWGHVRSRDLVHWEHLPIALWPSKEKGEDHCFSGCAVVDAQGRAMLVYTSIGGRRAPEQWAAVGEGDLRTFEKHPKNPLLTLKLHGDVQIEDWRDPFLFRDGADWYMVVGGHRKGGKGCICLYSSSDLVDWKFRGIPFEGTEDNWECPNFFRLGDRWALIYSPHGIVKYYVGDFDPKTPKFTPMHHGVVDHGDAFYAPNGMEHPQGRRLMWGWVRNFPGGRGWNGCLTIPRVLTIADDGALRQSPAPELVDLRGEPSLERTNEKLSPESPILARGGAVELDLAIRPGASKSFGVRLRRSSDGKRAATLTVRDGNLLFADKKIALGEPKGDASVKLRLFLDRSVLEVFLPSGECLTAIVSGEPGDDGVEVFAGEGDAIIEKLRLWNVASIWSTRK